jgi:hypothetical protein
MNGNQLYPKAKANGLPTDSKVYSTTLNIFKDLILFYECFIVIIAEE